MVCYPGEREQATVHRLSRRDEIAATPGYPDRSEGFTRAPLVEVSSHMTLDLAQLEPDGHVCRHLHSFEESVYVLDGHPILRLDGRSVRLGPGSGAFVPVGMPHEWCASDESPASWIEMTAPRRRSSEAPPDTFFVEVPASEEEVADVDVRDPRSRHFFQLGDGQLDVERSRTRGASVDEAAVSASMATALLAYSGISVKMLVDQRLGAHLHTMFMVEYQPGGVAHLHDHPFEESYYLLEGEVDVVADGIEFAMAPGDVLWTGVGCVHGFRNTSGGLVRWLETSAPQPPTHHSYRFNRDWEYLAAQLDGTRVEQPIAPKGARWIGS
jgi:quercetin dioxygenase-like cupin family protein